MSGATPGVVLAVGDLAPGRADYDESFAATRDTLVAADLTFGQLETSFATDGVRAPQARHAVLARPDGAAALGRAGFDLVSMAGNHVLDWGNDAFFATRANLEAAGMQVVGAGTDIDAARRPARFTMPDGTTLAFLAYSSILPMNYWADERRPGCAPLRAFTVYEQIEHDQLGTPPRIHSFPHRDDLAAMEAEICAAKAGADVVLVSMHWGNHFVRAAIPAYARDLARAAVAAGADAIFGGHPHILKGCELIDGKPVFHSLCNFATDLSLVLMLAALALLPESPAFLASGRARRGLTRLNRVRAGMGLSPLAAMPPPAAETGRIAVGALFAHGLARNSVLLWSAVTLGYFDLYFVISWIPKLANRAGLPLDQAIYAGAIYNLGAFVGTTLVGVLAVRFRLNRVIALFLTAAAAALLVFGGVAMPVWLTLATALAVGVTVQGGFNGFWGLAVRLYPAAIRGTGVGWALGVGRIGAVAGPVVGGLLVGGGVSIGAIFSIYAVPLVVAAALTLLVRPDPGACA